MHETPARSSEGESARDPRRARRMRFDPGSGSGHDLAPGRGSLLRAFRDAGARPVALVNDPDLDPDSDRRAEGRHRDVECLAWVGWRTWRGFHMGDALLIDLSRGGARVFLDERPPRGGSVWVFLETPGRRAVVKARVLEVETTGPGQCSARVGFLDPCPYALFEAAVCGLAAADPRARLAAPPRLGRLPAPLAAARNRAVAD